MIWDGIIIRLIVAFISGLAIGIERQWYHRMAGLRTNVLVSIGASLYVLLSAMTPGEGSPTRIAAQVVSGIGFLGGGVIIREGLSVRGLNTAATLWCSAAVGTLAGAGFLWQSIVGTFTILIANITLRPMARWINNRSTIQNYSEAHYVISSTCIENAEEHIRMVLMHMVNSESISLRTLYSEDIEGSNKVKIKAYLHSETRKDTVIEGIVGRLSLEKGITAIGWQLVTDNEHIFHKEEL